MSYATNQQMIVRYDARRLGQLVRDDGTVVSQTDLLGDPILSAVLDDASGLVDMVARTGERYSTDDLSQIASDPRTASPLVRLVCDLAYGLLWARRGYGEKEVEQQSPRYAWANKMLDKIEIGQLVFDNPAQTQAMRPDVSIMGSDASVNLVSRYTRIFGLRAEDFIPNYPQDPNAFGG